jgi:hypothetical protein
MSSKIFITPKDIENGFTSDQFIKIGKELEKNEIMYFMKLIQVQHGKADEFFEDLRDRFREISESKNRKEIIHDNNNGNESNVIYIDSAFSMPRQPI